MTQTQASREAQFKTITQGHHAGPSHRSIIQCHHAGSQRRVIIYSHRVNRVIKQGHHKESSNTVIKHKGQSHRVKQHRSHRINRVIRSGSSKSGQDHQDHQVRNHRTRLHQSKYDLTFLKSFQSGIICGTRSCTSSHLRVKGTLFSS